MDEIKPCPLCEEQLLNQSEVMEYFRSNATGNYPCPWYVLRDLKKAGVLFPVKTRQKGLCWKQSDLEKVRPLVERKIAELTTCPKQRRRKNNG